MDYFDHWAIVITRLHTCYHGNSTSILKIAELKTHDVRLKGATSRYAHLEKFSLNFSSSSFVICVNLLHS